MFENPFLEEETNKLFKLLTERADPPFRGTWHWDIPFILWALGERNDQLPPLIAQAFDLRDDATCKDFFRRFTNMDQSIAATLLEYCQFLNNEGEFLINNDNIQELESEDREILNLKKRSAANIEVIRQQVELVKQQIKNIWRVINER